MIISNKLLLFKNSLIRIASSQSRWHSSHHQSSLSSSKMSDFFTSSEFRSKTKSKLGQSTLARLIAGSTLTLLVGLAVGSNGVTDCEYDSISTGSKDNDKDERIKGLLPTDPITVQLALSKKTSTELALAVLVYKISSWNWLVTNALPVIEWSDKWHISGPIYFFIRHTFFRLFCGGENSDDVVPVMKSLQEAGIGSILDLSIEADESTSTQNSEWNHLSLTQKRAKVYEGMQHRLSTNAILTLESINMAGALPGSFCAVKVTSLAPTILLQNLSEADNEWKQIVYQVTDGNKKSWTPDTFEKCIKALPGSKGLSKNEMDNLYSKVTSQIGLNPWNQMRSVVSILDPQTCTLFSNAGDDAETLGTMSDRTSLTGAAPTELLPLDSTLVTMADLKELQLVKERLDFLCQKAREQKVKLMIDAEQSYFQPAIDMLSFELQMRYNRAITDTPENESLNSKVPALIATKCDDQFYSAKEPVVLTTYQMYLKKSFDRLCDDFELARKNNFCLGVKMVRGAYLVSERKRAQQLGYPDVIQDTLGDTHDNYNKGLDYVLDSIVQHSRQGSDQDYFPAYLVVASHNRFSIGKTIERLEHEHINPDKVPVAFGQLLGMYDTVSFQLAGKGYHVYKYVPYGPLKEVIPYLLRRAQENSSVFDSNNAEGQLIWAELKRRMFSF